MKAATREQWDRMLHDAYAMGIDIMRYYVPVKHLNQIPIVRRIKERELEELRAETLSMTDDDAWSCYIEQLYVALANTIRVLHAHIPHQQRSSDYGQIGDLVPCPRPTTQTHSLHDAPLRICNHPTPAPPPKPLLIGNSEASAKVDAGGATTGRPSRKRHEL